MIIDNKTGKRLVLSHTDTTIKLRKPIKMKKESFLIYGCGDGYSALCGIIAAKPCNFPLNFVDNYNFVYVIKGNGVDSKLTIYSRVFPKAIPYSCRRIARRAIPDDLQIIQNMTSQTMYDCDRQCMIYPQQQYCLHGQKIGQLKLSQHKGWPTFYLHHTKKIVIIGWWFFL